MTTISKTGLYNDFTSLAKLKQASIKDKNDNTDRQVAQQFEALFLQMMLKAGSKTGTDDSLMDNDQTKMYKGMLKQQVALDLANKGGIGLADVIVRSLKRR
jgi:flagellar protein FlgJ